MMPAPDQGSRLNATSLILLVGGLGTRLRSLSDGKPKALVEIHRRSFLEWQLIWMHQQGIRHVHLAAGYQGDVLLDWTQQQTGKGLPRLTASVEPEPLGTGGGLAYAWNQCEQETLFVANGDSLLPGLSLREMEQAHAGSASIAVTRMDDAARFGTIEFDDGGLVTAFREKATATAGWVNGGVYLATGAMRNAFPDKTIFSLEHDVFPKLVAERTLRVFTTEASLFDMGTPDGLRELTDYLEEDRA